MSTSTASRTCLETGWSFKKAQDGEDAWKPVAKVPTVAHMDLMDNGLFVNPCFSFGPRGFKVIIQQSCWLTIRICSIPDPFLNMNELDVEWVGESSWTYRTTFDSPKVDNGSSVFLIFEGLDTFAKVKLNDQVILESDNMFLSHRVNITDKITQSGSNTLAIDFESALLRGREILKEHPDHRFLLFNGEAGRLAVRKAQYHWVS